MPSRQLSTSAPPVNHHNRHHFLSPLLASTASACSLILLVLLCLRNRTRRRKRTTPSSDPPHQFSYAVLRRATSSFSTRLGQGGFGPVFSGSLPPSAKPVAVKLMDSASFQGEREFHNELFFASRLRSSSHVVPAIGFSSDPERRRFLLVYDLMHNGNLHDALLRRNCPELLQWNNRFAVVVDIAKGIHYLHSYDPPIIHGDIKPSNILLDRCFSAKIADFGLATLRSETPFDKVEILGVESEKKRKEELESDGGSAVEENEASPAPEQKNGKGNEVGDYVMDWIGKEVNKEREKGELVVQGAAIASSSSGTRIGCNKKEKNKKLEWWESMDEEKDGDFKKVKRRPVREWWKEEYSQELANKKKKKNKKKQHQNGGNSDDNDDDLWVRDDAMYSDVNLNRSRTKHRSRNSGGSVDSWLGGELRRASRNSYESAASGEIPKSGGVSSTPSMRGTMFYVAPEYGYNGDVSEKCDVYSFGVLLLVIISGRRPLQVMSGSPLSEFQRANLVSWARICARKGKLLELVDHSIQSLDKEQALLCIKLALLCLQKSPARRPSMKEVVGMLSGEMEPPQLLVEYSPSPSRFRSKSRKEEGR